MSGLEHYAVANGGVGFREGINWEEVETKISILVREFDNIDARFRDDLAQELRIHALLKSDDYYDLHRRAIDFWRSINRKFNNEVPFFDLELVGGCEFSKAHEMVEFTDMVDKIKVELTREGSVAETRLNTVSIEVLEVILEDLQGESSVQDSNVARYINGRISCTYLAERLPHRNYKMIRKALKNLEEVLTELMDMARFRDEAAATSY